MIRIKNSIKKFFSFLRNTYNPRYHLELVDKKLKENELFYTFKFYGSHEYIELNYEQIINNECFLTLIHPNKLLFIDKENAAQQEKNRKLFIHSENGNNEYEIKNNHSKHTYNGYYILKNIDYFPNLDIKDATLIAYNIGFNEGRILSKKIEDEINLLKKKETINSKNKIISINKLNHDNFR